MSLGSIKDYTPNYKFIIPEFDIATWHDYIEANFRSIDALLYNIFVINGYSGQWTNATLYRVNQVLFIGDGNDDFTGKLFKVKVQHTTPSTGNFKTFYTSHPTYYEQFADFDAAERAAQLAKDWANKTNGKVDGIEYSSKYYALQSANSAQQAATTLENAVTLTTNQNITGRKTFIGSYENVKLQLAANTTYTDLAFMNTSNTKLAYIRVKDDKELMLASDGLIKLSHAPTDNTTNSTQIDTVGARVTACNSLSNSIGDISSGLNNCMKLSGNQTINGIKTFKDNIITNIDAVRGVEPDGNKFGGIGIHDNNNNMFMSLLGSMDTDKNANVFLRVFNPNNTSTNAANSTYMTLHYKADGKKYVTCSSNDEPDAIITTINKSKGANGYFQLGNGLIIQWGKSTTTNPEAKITLPKAFTTTNYAVVGNSTQALGNSSNRYLSGWAQVVTRTTTNFTMYMSNYENSMWWNDVEKPFTWIAIGY